MNKIIKSILSIFAFTSIAFAYDDSNILPANKLITNTDENNLNLSEFYDEKEIDLISCTPTPSTKKLINIKRKLRNRIKQKKYNEPKSQLATYQLDIIYYVEEGKEKEEEFYYKNNCQNSIFKDLDELFYEFFKSN